MKVTIKKRLLAYCPTQLAWATLLLTLIFAVAAFKTGDGVFYALSACCLCIGIVDYLTRTLGYSGKTPY